MKFIYQQSSIKEEVIVYSESKSKLVETIEMICRQEEKLGLGLTVAIHGSSLYICYLGLYLINSWIPRNITSIVMFSIIFIATYLLIWLIIYIIEKQRAKQFNKIFNK